MNRLRLWIVLLLMIVTVLPLVAQQNSAPPAMNGALQDLSSRVGATVSLENRTLENWRWSEAEFPNAGLGCPEPGQMYAQVITFGYIFELTYQGTVYEYHTDSTGNNVRLCNQIGSDVPTPTPELEEQYSNALCQQPTQESGAYIRSRVDSGDLVIGATQNGFNRLRQQPDINAAVVSEIPQGAAFTIVGEAPVCSPNGYVWWQVDYDGVLGFVAEGLGNDYYIQALPPEPLPALDVITADNAVNLIELAEIQGNFGGAMDISPRGDELAVAGGIGSNSIFLYSSGNLATPRIIEQGETISTLTYHPNGQQMFLGAADGGTHLYNLLADAPVLETLYIQTHAAGVSAIASYPDGTIFASGGTNATVIGTGDADFDIVSYRISDVSQVNLFENDDAAVTTLAYKPDGSALVATTGESVLMWDTTNGALVFQSEAQETTGAFSPNGQFFVTGSATGAVNLYDASNMSRITTITGHLGAVEHVVFSPDTRLIASTSVDGTLRLWSTQTDAEVGVIELDGNEIAGLEFSPSGTFIAVMTTDGDVFLYGVALP